MVKTTRHGMPWIHRHGILPRLTVLLPLLLLAGCTGRGLVDLHPETLSFAPEAAGGAVSLVRMGSEVLGVFSDRSTASLDSVRVPVAEHLPAEAEVEVVDVVDFAPPLSAAFGRHMLTASGDTAALLYEDRSSADTTVLKLATRGPEASSWTVDAMEPPGDPLAVLASPQGGFDAFWAAGSLFWWRPAGITAEVMPRFNAAGASHIFGPDGFTAFNAADRSLYVVQRKDGIFRARAFAAGGPVQSSLESPDGTVSVLSWDSTSRRLLLYKDAGEGRAPAATTVTICDDTHAVALLPGQSGAPQLFLFDETSPSGGTRPHRVALVAPASTLGQPGNRYAKSVLFESAQAIEGFDAVETPGALYVLVQSAGMIMVRVPVQGGAAPLS